MGFKEFVSERSIDALVQREPSDLKAQLSSIEGVLGLMEEGPKKAKLNSKRLQLLEAIKRQSAAVMAGSRHQS
ncbi:hypothetical protein [Phaeovulum vinaykumarii]|uniref:hypothetical protein n=1 Tax=Phaeovulum vinaykumarii TaxID=407234 RepID=UPI00117A9663|nr:hypothetical protein [Phaeovulum vinaykumarii]